MQLTSSKTVVLTDQRDIEVIRHSRYVEKLLDSADDVIESLSRDLAEEKRKTRQAQRSSNHWQALFWILLSVLGGWGILGVVCLWTLHKF